MRDIEIKSSKDAFRERFDGMETGLRPSVELGAGARQRVEGLRYLATISNGWQPL